uniref:Fibronectin type-III domain-containing protein n=1 Tax=Mesocestoides corti TaxID=53468 RepID=A0A5K3FDD2_MESCO
MSHALSSPESRFLHSTTPCLLSLRLTYLKHVLTAARHVIACPHFSPITASSSTTRSGSPNTTPLVSATQHRISYALIHFAMDKLTFTVVWQNHNGTNLAASGCGGKNEVDEVPPSSIVIRFNEVAVDCAVIWQYVTQCSRLNLPYNFECSTVQMFRVGAHIEICMEIGHLCKANWAIKTSRA